MRKSSRRAFLRGEAAADALADRLTGDLLEPADAPHGAGYTLSFRRRAMACEFEIQVPADEAAGASEAAVAALDLVDALETQMTVYRETSEVMGINRRAAEGPVEVEPRLCALLELAERLYRETGGALDITSGPLSDAWGFSRRQGKLPERDQLAAAAARVGFQHVRLDRHARTIAFTRPGIEINLNAIGKGYALDRAAELLEAEGVRRLLFHGGRSSLLARGSPPGGSGGWSVGLRHPWRPAERLGEFSLCDRCLATSGSGTQFFRHQGKRLGHLLDPRTGYPATGMLSATVVAPTAAEADALSTAFYIMGPDAVAEYHQAHPEIAALLVTPGRAEATVRLHPFGLTDANWRQIADD